MMDGSRFDALTRSLVTTGSRRSLLAGLGGVLGLIGLRTAEAACRAPGRTCREHADCCSGLCGAKDRTGRRTCRCRSRADCPEPTDQCHTASCLLGVCGETVLIGQACDDGDPCTTGTTCQADGSCGGGTAAPGGPSCACAAPYVCGEPSPPDSPVNCAPDGGECPQYPGYARCLCFATPEETTACGDRCFICGDVPACETSADCASLGDDYVCAVNPGCCTDNRCVQLCSAAA
jgi:hypothetical protein